jgi:hypothetical protein
MCLVIIICGIVSYPFYSMLFQAMQLRTSEQGMALTKSGLAEYVRIYGYYPCPANMAAAPGANDYAQAQPGCAGATNIAGVNGGQVFVGAVPVDDLRSAMSCAQAPAGLSAELASVFRPVLFTVGEALFSGAPTQNNGIDQASCLSRSNIADQYGNKFLYAVSSRATSLATFDPLDPTVGQIEVVDENNNSATANNLTYVLVSFGRDGQGAVTRGGQAGVPCGPAANNMENENCNGDAVFRSMPKSTAFNNYFDDDVAFSLAGSMRENDSWYWADSGNPNARNTYFDAKHSKLIIGQIRPGGVDAAGDFLNVNQGNLHVGLSGGAGGSLNIMQGVGGVGAVQLHAGQNLTAGGSVTAGAAVFGDKFCYGAC